MERTMKTESVPPTLPILGVPVTVFDSYDHAAGEIRRRIVSRRQTFCVAINPSKIYLARRDSRVKRILDAAQIRICDGIGVAVAARLLHRRRIERCTGVELFFHVIALAARERWKVFLLGASPESNAAARRNLLQAYPGLSIVGSQDGYFKNSAEVVAAINESGAELLFVAMGSPRQELWVGENLPRLNVRFCMGLGGTLDVVSGVAKWAPAFWRKTGTEWLFRALTQPRRRFPVLWTNGLFMLDVLKAALAGQGETAEGDKMKPAA
jgi:N-acetylglucosaminyldiphosphoundecaprenol N-acetyl-beta-D-mannosaminyltransferase